MTKVNMNKDQLQSYGTVAALIISIVALFVTLYEANVMKTQSKAMVWPYFYIGTTYGADGFSFIARNQGTGPAIIKSVEVKFGDQVIQSFDELLDIIKPDRVIGYDRLNMRQFNGTVFKAGEEKIVFRMPWDEETREMVKQMPEVSFKVQYESILEDYWVFESHKTEHARVKFKAEREFNPIN